MRRYKFYRKYKVFLDFITGKFVLDDESSYELE